MLESVSGSDPLHSSSSLLPLQHCLKDLSVKRQEARVEGRCYIKQIAVPTFSFRSCSKESLVSLVSSKVGFGVQSQFFGHLEPVLLAGMTLFGSLAFRRQL